MSHGLSGLEWSDFGPGLDRGLEELTLSSGRKHATEYLCAERGRQTADLNEADRIVAQPSAVLH